MKLTTRDRGLETLVIQSAVYSRIVTIDKHLAGAKWIGKGKVLPMPGVVDFTGVINSTGRSIVFDAKESGKSQGYYLSDLKPHQRDYLIRYGEAGAVAGLICEATHAAVRMVFWIPWDLLVAERVCVGWGDIGIIDIGWPGTLIDFSRVPGVVK